MSKNCGRRCKERDGFYFWSDTNDRDKHFFKIMAGGFRERLTIPQKFVQHFLGKTTRTILLESRNGSTFDVQVINDLGKVILGSGWEAFVRAHDLNMGDFLVFKYDGSSHLKVLIFDPSGCEKPSSVAMKNATHKSQRKEPVGMSNPYHEIAMKSSPNESKAWVQWDSSNQENNIININSSSTSHESSDTAFSEDDQEFVPRYIFPCGTYLTGALEKKVKERVGAIHSEIPIHGCVMKKSNIHGRARCVNLSRGYADAHLRFKDQELMLQRHGKNWEVRCVKMGKRVRLWKGWNRFASDNNLRVGDVCLFELLKNKEYTMNVHVIRKR